MGFCHEFGVVIENGCDHLMVAREASCSCTECGAECTGRFSGCTSVWAGGPVAVSMRARVEHDTLPSLLENLPPITLPDLPPPRAMDSLPGGSDSTVTAPAPPNGSIERARRGRAGARRPSVVDMQESPDTEESGSSEEIGRVLAEVDTMRSVLIELIEGARAELEHELAVAVRARTASESAHDLFDRSQVAFEHERARLSEAITALGEARVLIEGRVSDLDERLPRLRAAGETALAAAETATAAAASAARTADNAAEAERAAAAAAAQEMFDRVSEIDTYIERVDRLAARQAKLAEELERLLTAAADIQRASENRLARIPTDIDATSFTDFKRANSRIGRVEPLAWLALVGAVMSVGMSLAAIVWQSGG